MLAMLALKVFQGGSKEISVTILPPMRLDQGASQGRIQDSL